MADQNLSLFGWPEPEPREAGRPEHIPTDENRNKIMMLLVFGMTNAEIAKAVGVSQPTLRKHYLQQLAQRRIARLQLDATRFAALYGKMLTGDVGANKELHKQLQDHDRKELAKAYGSQAQSAPRKAAEPKAGKKQQAKQDAQEVVADAGDWGGDLVPGQVN